MTPLDYYLWGVVKDKCNADKSETIDVLKDNIREAIDEIQLHIIHTLKSRRNQNESLFGEDFGPEQGEAVTVNGDRYRAMLNEFLFTKI